MMGVLAAILGDETSFTFITSNSGAPAITPAYSRFSALADEATEARINAGFHYRTSCNVAQRIGYSIADQIMRSTLLPHPGSGVINLALRGRTGAGADTLIAGFVVGAGSRQVLIRGIGPGLSAYGLSGVVADPRIVLYDSSGRAVAENDNWSSSGSTSATLTAVAGRAGAFPLVANSLDAALLATLTPGSYTVHLSGAPGTSGLALIEAYEVP